MHRFFICIFLFLIYLITEISLQWFKDIVSTSRAIFSSPSNHSEIVQVYRAVAAAAAGAGSAGGAVWK